MKWGNDKEYQKESSLGEVCFVAGCNSEKKTFPFPTKFFCLLFNVTLHLAVTSSIPYQWHPSPVVLHIRRWVIESLAVLLDSGI